MYETDDLKLKRGIIHALSSNLTLKDKKLEISRDSWVYPLQEIVKEIKRLKRSFEPIETKDYNGFLYNMDISSILCSQ